MAEGATQAALASARTALERRPGLKGALAELDDIESGLRGRMRVALVGRVSAGKSTLTNALLGGSRAPSGAQELTYNVTWIRYGDRPSLTIHYRGGQPPRAADVEALARHVRRPDGAEPVGTIDHLEVTDPAPYLRSFDLVDTPGLDSVFGEDSANTLRFLGGPVDAMVLVVSRGMQAREPDLLADFQGHSLSPSPINAIAALTKVEHLWDRRSRPDPMAVGREIAAQMMSVPAVRRVVHHVFPVASLVGAAAALLTERDLADLLALSAVPAEDLARWVRRDAVFAAPGPVPTAITPERRAALWRALSPYGVVLACDVLRGGAHDLRSLRAELDERTGMAAFRRSLIEHFGSRAELVMLDRAFARVQMLPTRFGPGRSPGEVAALRSAAKEFSRHALVHVPRFRELEVLRNHYAGRLDLTDDDAAELLRIAGESGRDARAYLGLSPDAPISEVREQARRRMTYWRERQIWDGSGGATREALRVLVRAYERLVDTVEDIRWEDTR